MNRSTLIGGTIGVVLALIGGLLVVTSLTGDDASEGASEVFLEPVQSVGTDPFFAQTQTLVDITPILLPSPTTTVVAANEEPGDDAPEGVATQAVSGAAPGLYGGTRDNSRCDRLKLVEFLESDPDKAAAWAEVQGIETDQIREFVDTLTPAVLLSDTRVTNHGFRNGRANPIQSVLQAGTAVLIDDTGLPRARCACGNPLNKPIPQTTVRYVGPAWGGFDAGALQVVDSGPGTDQFVLQDLEGGDPFARPSGSDGEADFAAPPEAIGAITAVLLVPELGDPDSTTAVGGAITAGAEVPDGDGDGDSDASDDPRSATGSSSGVATLVVTVGEGTKSSLLGDLLSATLTADVDGDNVTLTLDATYQTFLRGGPDELDRNCAGTAQLQAVGSGTTGETSIFLTVVTGELSDLTGSVCVDIETGLDLYVGLLAEGRTAAHFVGFVDATAIVGELTSIGATVDSGAGVADEADERADTEPAPQVLRSTEYCPALEELIALDDIGDDLSEEESVALVMGYMSDLAVLSDGEVSAAYQFVSDNFEAVFDEFAESIFSDETTPLMDEVGAAFAVIYEDSLSRCGIDLEGE